MKYISGILLHDKDSKKLAATCNHKHITLYGAYRCLGKLSDKFCQWDMFGRIYRADETELLSKEKIKLIEIEVKNDKKI